MKEEIVKQARIGNNMLISIINSVNDDATRDEDGTLLDGYSTFLRIWYGAESGSTEIENWEVTGTPSDDLLAIASMFTDLAIEKLKLEKKWRAKKK